MLRAWPQVLKIEGAPGSYIVVLKDGSQTTRIEAGAIILDLGEQDGQVSPEAGAVSGESRIGRIMARSGILANERPAGLREFAIKETAGIFVLPPAVEESPEAQVLEGTNAAARALAYLYQGTLVPRGNTVTVDTKLCRGCGDCAAVCSYIEMRERGNGVLCAYIDRALCLGCGLCTAHCPTGAITQSQQSDEKIGDTLEALLGRVASTVEAI